MPQLARDEAGHVWDVSDPANPKLVQSAQGPNVVMPSAPPEPKFVPGHPELVMGQGGQITSSGVPADPTKPTFIEGRPGFVMQNGAAQPIPNLPPDPGKTLDPSVRQKSIQGYQFADLLQNVVKDLRTKYAAGPGKTSGVMGTADYLPLTRNKSFDSAADAARGIIGQTLQFTGGQLNTEHESEMNLGPYLPHSGDRDEVIKEKLDRLQSLAETGRKMAVQTLGGAPDANGVIKPEQTLATGATRDVPDPEASRALDTFVRAGRPYAEVAAYAQSHGFNPPDPQTYAEAAQYHREHPEYKGSFGDAVKTVPTTMRERISASAPAAAVAAAGNAVLGDRGASMIGAINGDPEGAKAGLDALRGAHPVASLAGDIAGQGLFEAGLGRIPGAQALMATKWGRRGADALYGGYAGSGDDSNGDPLSGGLAGAGINMAGGMFGRGSTRAVGGTLSGVKNAALQKLDNLGVPLTLGQIGRGSNNIVGRAIGGIEERATGLPGFDAVIGTARQRGDAGFNRAVFKEAGGTGATGAAGLDELNGLRKNAYSFLDGTNMPLDAQFAGSQAGVKAGIPDLPAFGNEISKGLNLIDSTAKGGSIPGRDWQSALSDTRGNRSSIAGQPFSGHAVQSLKDIEDNLLGLANRQGPAGTLDNLNAANKLHGQTETIAAALDSGPAQRNGQMFSPQRLDDASRVNTRKFGGRVASLTGKNRPFYDLSQAGLEVMPNLTADSGTAGRMLLVPLAMSGIGGGVGALTGDDRMKGGELGAEYGALLGGAAIGPYSKGGQKVIQKALLGDRPDQFVRIGDYIVKKSALGGMFGSGAARNYNYQLNQ